MTDVHMSNTPVTEPVAPVPVSEPTTKPVEPTKS